MATREQVDELKQKMAEGRAALFEAARSLSPEDALRVPVDAEGEEQWTALEQLAHLWEMERTYKKWVQAAVAMDGADLNSISWQEAPIPVEAANGAPREEIIRGMEAERADTLAMIDSFSLDQFDHRGTNRAFGSLTVLQWLRSYYRHDRQHFAQILGRKSEFQPTFAPGVGEPEQRKARLALVARRQQEARQ